MISRRMASVVAAVLLAGAGLSGCSDTTAETATPEPSSAPSVAAVSDEVPDLTDLSVDEAVAKLSGLDMGAKFIEMSTGDEIADAAGRSVLQTFPESGKSVLSGRVVTLFVGAGEVPPTAAPPAALTAQAVVDSFATAGLPVTDARDNTAQNCTTLGCVQMITTEDITVLSFIDQDTAAAYVAKLSSADLYHSGPMVLSYAAARTPAEARPAYEAALAVILSQEG